MRFLAWLKNVLRNDDIVSAVSGTEVEPPFYDKERKRRAQVWTSVLYFAFAMFALVISSLVPEPPEKTRWDPPGLVFVMEPGPGGGGGGSGESEQMPSEQEIAGEDEATVAVNVEVPEPDLVFDDPDKPEEPEAEEEEEPEEEEAPTVKAPVVAQAPDEENQKGTLDGANQLLEVAGTGTGTGIGEGEGSGLGPGTGGGFGGGAYRMGSGIEPPSLRKQVRPVYTQEALAKKVEGVVLLEVVILKEGRIGPVRVLKGLSAGLNQQAIECVRQWLFIPGKFKGTPVDVIGEIEVEFSIL